MQKRKLVLPALVVAAGAALLGSGTFASFTDAENSPVQSVAAGSLDVEWVDTGLSNSAIGFPLNVSNQQPGATEPTRQLHLKNVGTLPAQVTLYVKKTKDVEDADGAGPLPACPEPEALAEGGNCGTDGELDQKIKVNLDGFVGAGDTLASLAVGEMGQVNGPSQSGADSVFTLQPGQDKWIAVDYEIPLSAGNEIMTDGLGFEVHVRAEQV